jgi:hypothetical protein
VEVVELEETLSEALLVSSLLLRVLIGVLVPVAVGTEGLPEGSVDPVELEELEELGVLEDPSLLKPEISVELFGVA